MHTVSKQELQDTLQQLNQAIYNHEQWSKNLIRSMICRLPYDSRDIADDAHHHCRFGHWYYGSPPQAFLEHPAFKAIGVEHRRMHQVTARLLLESESKGEVAPLDYDNFISAAERLRLEIYSFKHEIEESLNTRDPLTGAENRFNMLSRLRELRELSKRGVQDCSIAIMDLDHFKRVNDTYGHAAGDQVLVAWVNYIKKNLRKYDRVYRYGGEEFLLSFPGNDQQSVKELIERLRDGIPEITLEGDEAKSIMVTASFGITTLDPSLHVEESINRADIALYAAKKAGRNCSCIWDSSMASMHNVEDGDLDEISGETSKAH